MKGLYQKYGTFIRYGLFGIPPSIVNFGTYSLFIEIFDYSAAVSTMIPWIFGLVISFLLYRRFVFDSPAATPRIILKEFTRFCSVRAGTGGFEVAFIWIFVDKMGQNAYLFKIAASGVAIAVNYLVSKYMIFEQNKHKKTVRL